MSAMKAAALRSAIESWPTSEVTRKSFGPSFGQRKTSHKQSFGEGSAWIVVRLAVGFSVNRQGEPSLQWARMGVCASVPLRQVQSMFSPADSIGNGKRPFRLEDFPGILNRQRARRTRAAPSTRVCRLFAFIGASSFQERRQSMPMRSSVPDSQLSPDQNVSDVTGSYLQTPTPSTRLCLLPIEYPIISYVE